MQTEKIPVNPLSYHVDPEDPHLLKFCLQLNSKFKPVQIQCVGKNNPLGLCYWNAKAASIQHGGIPVFGWLFSLWPNSHIEAMHHAVYKSVDGTLYDVTPRTPYHENQESSVFLEDDSIEVDLERIPKITSKFYKFKSSTCTDNFIKNYQKTNKLEKKLSDLMYKTGYRAEGQLSVALNNDIPDHVLPLLEKMATSTELATVREEISIQQDKLGAAITLLKKM